MPELPEVERAKRLLKKLAENRIIQQVDAFEDNIVFSGCSHEEFAAELRGREVLDVIRYGKLFYMVLGGKGRMPVFHFGMTGMLQVKGELPTYYREKPSKIPTTWPPKGSKFVLHLGNDGQDEHFEVAMVAFMDVRRLGRVRLCSSPKDEPPISELGFDPLLSMIDLAEFKRLVLQRTCPIKALLLDQSFSAGVGNWVADEILFHARVHPEQRCSTLTDESISQLHHFCTEICRVAVNANADDTKFPEDWLFKHRWGRGKGKNQEDFKLPDGRKATIKWVTVGGRTSAYVEELQKIRTASTSRSAGMDVESDNTALPEEENEAVQKPTKPGSKKRKVTTGDKSTVKRSKIAKRS